MGALLNTSPAAAEADEADAAACGLCHGAGFVVFERPYDDPRFGKAEPCRCTLTEPGEVRRTRLERLSNLGSLTRFTFDSLNPGGREGANPGFAAAMEAVRAFAENPAGWLTIHGPSGSGKTHLAAAIANQRIQVGAPAYFTVVPDLLDVLRSSYDAPASEDGFDPTFEQVRNAPLLILDDMDAASGTPWAKEKLFQIVNHRFNTELPTVFTCTTRPELLEERLATRLCNERLGTAIGLGGPATAPYRQVGGMTRDRLAEMQFSDLIESSAWNSQERASFGAAVTTAREYAEGPYGWLVVMGHNGCGKTHLAAAIANKALKRGDSVFFAVVPDLLDHLRASFHPTAETTYDETFDQVRNAGLLILDDLGAQKASPWAEEKLYQIVNYRSVSRLPTVVTTDLDVRKLDEVHPRIYARILDPHAGTKVEMLTPHYALGRSPARGGPPTRRGAR